MADKNAPHKPSVKKKKPTNSKQMWNNFLKEIDKTLNDIYANQVKVEATDAKELETFTKQESNLRTVAEDFSGPPAYTKVPDWKAILSKKPSHSHIQFRNYIDKVLEEQSVAGEEKGIREIGLLRDIHAMFQSTFQTQFGASSEKPNKESLIIWIETAIIQLEGELGADQQVQIIHMLTGSIYKNFKNNPSWTTFEEASTGNTTDFENIADSSPDEHPCAKFGKKGIWPENFCKPIWEILNGDPGKEKKALERLRNLILDRLSGSLHNYNQNDETAIRTWISTTINGISSKTLSNFKKEELIAVLENVITQIFPQPDKLYFYDIFQTKLYQNIYNPPKVDVQTQKILNSIKKDQKHITEIQEHESQLRARLAEAHSPSGKKHPKNPVTKPHDKGGKSPDNIEALIDSFVKGKKLSFEKESEKEFKREIRRLIESGISKTFENLVDQGSQGELISVTYDKQTINRISDYTVNLLTELNTDLDKDIPKNGSLSLDAAKKATAAAIAFNQYAQSLGSLTLAFEGEGDKQNNGTNYTTIKKLVNGPSGDKAGSLDDLANEIYLGAGTPEPLVKNAEFFGVKLAANTAGLNTSLQKLLLGEQHDAIKALNKLKSKASAIFEKKRELFNTDADNYFKSLDKYVKRKQDFERDLDNNEIIYQSREFLTNLIEMGELDYMEDSIKGLQQ